MGTDEMVEFRVLLQESHWHAALEKRPFFDLWGLDVSERHVKLFIRGDENAPVLNGALAGRCVPNETCLQLEGHCLVLTLVKALDSMDLWPFLLREEANWRIPSSAVSPQQSAARLKEEGDAGCRDGRFRDAIVHYTRALHMTKQKELYSNRSLAYWKIEQFQLGLDDAMTAEGLDTRCPKVKFRKGQALRSLERYDEAITAFEAGRTLDLQPLEWDREILLTTEIRVLLGHPVAERGE